MTIRSVSDLGCILSNWAHPDDEAYLAAGIMAMAARDGRRVVCVTATKGEGGSPDPERWPPAEMGCVRERELRACLDVLGVDDHRWLGYLDGDCENADATEAIATIVAILDEVRPDTIVTFGPDGFSDHPDHKTRHHAGMERIPPQLTFLFTDIEGSAREWEQSPAMHQRVEDHFEVLRTCVHGSGGTVFATMGDGIAAAFTAAPAAVHAAVAAQLAVATIGLRVRMGIHSGTAERVGSDFRGPTVNRAARLMGLGHGGQILVSGIAAEHVRCDGSTAVCFVDLGMHQLRGLAESEHVWQVDHPSLGQTFPALRNAAHVGGADTERVRFEIDVELIRSA